MDDFETFKASRVIMDPSSRQMTDHQWKQSYAAYQGARKRVGINSELEVKGNKRGMIKPANLSNTDGSILGSQRHSTISAPCNSRQSIRQKSAYADLRLTIDILAWVAIAIFLMIGVVSTFFYTSASVVIIALLWTGVQIIAVIVVRMLTHVVIDIPDIALHQSLHKSDEKPNLD